MSQAKTRGTYEERKAAAMAKAAEEQARKREERAAQEAALTPEKKEARHRARMLMSFISGIACSTNITGPVSKKDKQ